MFRIGLINIHKPTYRCFSTLHDKLSPKVQSLAKGILDGDRVSLARGITLVESLRGDHQEEASTLVSHVLRHTAHPRGSLHPHTYRIGISGAPGVGKSTFIESFGSFLTNHKHRVAVLAVDPSSSLSGGSILGDKTRMPNLSKDINAYVRPSPTRGTLGGITKTTADAITLCEAAGYDIVIVETVGVGQSEFAVADLVDIMVLLVSPGGGDELQGIKRGIVELADLLIVTKADGNLREAALAAQSDYAGAINLTTPRNATWKPRTILHSVHDPAHTTGVWEVMEEYRRKKGNELHETRADQNVLWMWRIVEDLLLKDMKGNPEVQYMVKELERGIREQSVAPSAAAVKLITKYLKIKAGT